MVLDLTFPSLDAPGRLPRLRMRDLPPRAAAPPVRLLAHAAFPGSIGSEPRLVSRAMAVLWSPGLSPLPGTLGASDLETDLSKPLAPLGLSLTIEK